MGKIPLYCQAGIVWYLAFVMLSLKFMNRTGGTIAE